MESVELVNPSEVNQEVIDPAVQRRLRTLIELAVAIGRREGMIGRGESN